MDSDARATEDQILKGFDAILAESEEAGEEGAEGAAPQKAAKTARRKATAKAEPEPEGEEPGAEEAGSEPDEDAGKEAEPKEARADQDEEAEESQEETDEIEVPDTFEGLAEALGRDPDQLAGHIRVQIKADGRTASVPLSEVVASYQQAKTWTRKHEALANERRSYDQERQAFNQLREQDIQGLAMLVQTADRLIQGEAEELPAALEKDDPVEFWSKKDRLRDRREQLGQLYQGISGAIQHSRLAAQQQLQAMIGQSAQHLAEAVPEWGADTAKAQREIAELRAWARKEFGYTQDETDSLFDHRTILAFRELRQLKERHATAPLLAKQVKAKLPLKKVTKPGAAADIGDHKKVAAQKLRDRFRKSGDIRDGARLLMELGQV